MNRARQAAGPLLLLLPGALTVYLGFNSGGLFPTATGFVAIALALALIARLALAVDPFEGLSVPVALAGGALALLAAWALASGAWSDSWGRAALEFDRVVVYGLAFVLFGTIARTSPRLRTMLWGLAAAMLLLSAAGLVTRTLPDVWTLAPEAQNERLGYPIGYWNALGLVSALGLVFCLHLSSDDHEPRVARVLGAAAIPILATTLFFTFSRGPLAAALVGLLVYALVARPRLLPTGLLAAAPPTVIALIAAYRADLLASKEPATAAATAQGHDVALAVAVCVLVAGLLRALLLPVDARLLRLRLSRSTRRYLVAGTAAVVVAGIALALATTDAADRVDDQYDRLTTDAVLQTGDNRDRLTNPGINRLEQWRVALRGFRDDPLRGDGAGTFVLQWLQERPTDSVSFEAHSLYLETLGELGLPGLLLLIVALGAIVVCVARRIRGPDRAVYGALFAGLILWLLSAAVDWHWELPAVSLWLFAAGGLALATPPGSHPRTRAPGPALRAVVALGCALLVVTPARAALSQARLSDALSAYGRADCPRAIDHALASASALGTRPEPYEVIAYCDTRLGLHSLALKMIGRAVDREPRNWRYHYGTALVRAAARRDPRPAAREALRLNPKEPIARTAVRRFRSDDPESWRRAVEELAISLR